MSERRIGVYDSPLVSIVMPLYNCEAYLGEAIGSVLAQSYPNWELLVVDDRSSDDSYRIAKEFAEKDSRILVWSLKENSGPAIARNVAIEKATGRYIAFLDSDDLWHPLKLERQVSFLKNCNVPLIFSDYQRIDENGVPLQLVRYDGDSLDYKELLKQNVIGCLTAMYDTVALGKCYFDTTLEKHEDYQYWLEIVKKSGSVAKALHECLAFYRVRRGSLSSNKITAALYVWKILRVYQGLPFGKSIYYFGCYTYRNIRRRLIK